MAISLSSGTAPASISKPALWAGRFLTGFSALFLLMDGIIKLVPPASVLELSAKMGFSAGTLFTIGVILIASTVIYLIPALSVLGAVLLTAYLGGAIETHVRIGSEPFSLVFPLIVAAMVWGGLYLREPRLKALLPLRRRSD